MKISIYFCLGLLNLGALAAERQLPENQTWDAKKFYKATKQSLPLAKTLLDEFEWRLFSHVLDIGCGPGSLTEHIARHAPHARVEGIDPNAGMIKFAQGYYQKPANLSYAQALLPSSKSKHDFYFSCNAFHLLTRAQQIEALNRIALCADSAKDTMLFIIMAAKTEKPEAIMRAYAATLKFPRWEKLRSINLDEYFQPHSIESFKELAKDTGFKVTSSYTEYEHIKFKNSKRLKRFIASWMGGFEFVAQLPHKEQKKLVKDLVTNYLEEMPADLDGKVEWKSSRLIVEAVKPKAS